jgi:amino acid transporter
VSVSISSAAQYASAAVPALRGSETTLAISAVLIIMLINLRGVRESGSFFAIPVYAFMFSLGTMIVVGFVRYATGTLPLAASAQYDVLPTDNFTAGLTGLAGAYLVLRAFASGCAALTGVEAISNGVPSFRPPKSKNAATTLLMLGTIAITFLMSILILARLTGVRYVADPATRLLNPDGTPVGEGYHQAPSIGQISEAVFAGFPIGFYVVTVLTGLILVLAANTAFNGFPVLGSILARDNYLPRQLHTRGDRLAFSNGIVALGLAAVGLIWAAKASVTVLIQLYVVGVFVAFTLSQFGMTRHWNRELRTEPDPAARRRMKWSRLVFWVGFGLTGTVLTIVLVTKFIRGAWIAILAMALIYAVMLGIHRHYESVLEEVDYEGDQATARTLPSRVHAIVLISRIHLPTLRALAYARAARPATLEAVTVGVDPEEIEALRSEWEQLGLPLPLRVLDSPYREISRPVIEYVRSIRRESPRDLVMVYIPELVVGHWWEQFLHNQSALRLKARLLYTPGVAMVSVPWQLASSEELTGLAEDLRRRDRS